MMINRVIEEPSEVIEERFWVQVDKTSLDKCWHWLGVIDAQGYGKVSLGARGRDLLAHRVSYHMFVDRLDDNFDLTVEHMCHTQDKTCEGGKRCLHRRCVNPQHLEVLTRAENASRANTKDSFICGHPYVKGNTYTRSNGIKNCRTCHRSRESARRRKTQKTDNGLLIDVRTDNRFSTEIPIKVRMIETKASTLKRLMQKVVLNNDCWIWNAGKDPNGYGVAWIDGKSKRAPKTFYELLVGDVPSGLQLDHVCHTRDKTCPGGSLCGHRACVRPSHLEPVTSKENVHRGKLYRKEHCINGHPFNEENIMYSSGKRYCRTCHREKSRRYREKNLEKIKKYDRDWKRKNVRGWTEAEASRPKLTAQERRERRVDNPITPKTNKSGFRGVFKEGNKWRVGITVDGKQMYLGAFANKDDAIKKRKEAELQYWGKS